MSPEQAEGGPLDARSDVFSFGIVLYEMLAGRRPFRGSSTAAHVAALLKDPPTPIEEVRPEVTAALRQVVGRCLEKDPARRYPSAVEIEATMAAIVGETRRPRRRKWLAAAAVAALALAASAIGWLVWRSSQVRWAREVALPEVERLYAGGKTVGALRLLGRAGRWLPDDPQVAHLRRTLTRSVDVRTTPPGARVFVNAYDGGEDGWEPLGRTPLERQPVPYGRAKLRFVLDGYETVEAALDTPGDGVEVGLDRAGAAPGMVSVTAGHARFDGFPPADLAAFHLDKFEVTNRRYKAFVDAGGYAKREFWKERFVRDGVELRWDDAVGAFRDATGRPGPATWQFGTYPEGHADDPVSGVSWFEATAYAAFEGKSLPTLYHWRYAAGEWIFDELLRESNFDPRGPVPVGTRKGLGPYGTYDMAGNVKEWCSTEARDGLRYLLGGGFDEPPYMFNDLDARSPWERKPDFGFRCARYDAPLPDAQRGALVRALRDYDRERPADDARFDALRGLYSFDRTPLEPRVDFTDDSNPSWRREKVSFAAAYGGERVAAWLFLPRNVAPPFQTVVFFPGADALAYRSSDEVGGYPLTDWIPRSGRALLFPIYKGTFDRTFPIPGISAFRDLVILWYKDLARAIDFVESRPDLDRSRVAYYGISMGANRGPLFTALDTRFRASVLLGGGFPGDPRPPEIDPINFAPRVRVPTLVINGRSDYECPPATCSEPMFRLLGTAGGDKKFLLLDSGHLPMDPQPVIREILDWLDRYLGPVSTR